MQKASKGFISDLKKQKRTSSLLFLDNLKIIKDAISNKSIQIECVLTSMEQLPFFCDEQLIFKVDDKTIEQLADTKTPQKVLCIASYKQHVVTKPNTNFLVLDGLQDPGNVGTLIRTAKACGFEFVYLVDCVKRNNPKLIRSSVGAVFDEKIMELSREDFLKLSEKENFNLIMCDMEGENIFEFADSISQKERQIFGKNKNCIQWLGVVVGSEGQGVSKEMEKLCKFRVKIPMKAGIESLNAGVSGSIIMYELQKRSF